MRHFRGWPRKTVILLFAAALVGLGFAVLVHLFPSGQVRRRAEAVSADGRVQRRRVEPPRPAAGAGMVLRQLAVVAVIALVGRKVLRIHL